MKKRNIYDDIKKMIITGELKQGQSIIEKELIDKFKVSRTPIREALKLLDIDKWIIPNPRKGYSASTITFKEVKDLFQTRYEIEPICLKIGSKFFEEKELMDLKNEIKTYMKSKDHVSLRLMDEKFHNYLIKSTYNDYLIKTMKFISEQANRMRYLTFRDIDTTLDSAMDHIKIIDLILKNDINKAMISLQKHIDKSQLYFIKNFNFKG